MFSFEKILPSPESTNVFAKQMAGYLMPGDVIALSGPLGAGKSHFARALIKALGCQQDHLPSPTFTLMQMYDDTQMPVAHADFYRLENPEEVDALVLERFIGHGLTLIEWPEKAEEIIPKKALWVHIEDHGNGRKFTFRSEDGSWEKRFGFFVKELQRVVTEKGRLSYLEKQTGKKGQVLSAVSEDASFRSYWRFQGEEGSRILMDAPPPMEDVARFTYVANYLRSVGIHAPEVYDEDTEKGYAIIEDFGNTTFTKAIKNGADMLTLYEKAIDVIIHIAKQGPIQLPEQTVEGWQDYLCLYTDWYMPIVNKKATHTADRRQFRSIVAELCKSFMAAPKTTIMGDYHPENLMLLGDGKTIKTSESGMHPLDDVGVLDFQDAVVGPNTYDLARFIYDIRLEQPPHIRELLLQRFLAAFPGKEEVLKKSYQIGCLFHGLRLYGVLHRLAYRDGKTRFLDYMPQVERDFTTMLDLIPEAEPLKRFIEKNTPCAPQLQKAAVI